MATLAHEQLQRKARLLRLICLLLWLLVTLAPVSLSRTHLALGSWSLDFWMAAQGCVLAYLLIVTVYAGLLNRWEQQAQSQSFEVPSHQDAGRLTPTTVPRTASQSGPANHGSPSR